MTTHISTGFGLISAFKGNKNALLLIAFSFYYKWVETLLLNTSIITRQYIHKDIVLPYKLAMCAFFLLCLEGWANKYLIAIEHFRFLQQSQETASWPAPTQTYYTAFVGLCSLLFRPFFRMTLIVIPVLTPFTERLNDFTPISWMSNLPLWTAGAWLLWSELKVLFYLSKPASQPPHFLKEALARWVLMTLLALCMVTFKVGFRSFFWLPSPITVQSLLIILFPFSLFFTMFFLPLRLVEFWVDWVDCRTLSRKIIYIASAIWLMFTIVTH